MTGRPAVPTIRRDCRCPTVKHVHGTNQAYNADMCRCDECRAAHASLQGQRRRLAAYGRWEPWASSSAGSARRLQALACIGWSRTTLSMRLGTSESHIGHLRSPKANRITVELARRVTALYDELWDKPNTAVGSCRTRREAARKGWLPPMAWDDDTIDDPAAKARVKTHIVEGELRVFDRRRPDHVSCDEIIIQRLTGGEPVAVANIFERREAVARLVALGMSDADIGRRIGLSQDAVLKIRHRHIQGRAA